VIRRTTSLSTGRRASHCAALAASLVAVVALSSCSSPSSPGSDVVASANGVELSGVQLQSLVPPTVGAANGEASRTTMTQWIQVAAVGHDMSTITDAATLQSEASAAAIELAAPFLPAAGETYAKGLGGSPKVCLGAVPIAADTDPNEVIDAMTSGLSLPDAATKYSSDPAFVSSGGVLTFQDGTTCVDPTQLNPDVVTQMGEALPGEPVLVQLGNGQAIVVIRAFDTLTPNEQLSISPDVQQKVADEFNAQLRDAEIYVDKRFGRWEPSSASVVALVTG
jgi:hypothetical protein